jgi:hypothetical protein
MIQPIDNYDDVIYTNAVSMMDEPQLFPIPTNMIINKGKTGWGATHCEIKAKRNSIILLPHISQIDSKFNQYQHSDNVVKVTESAKPIDLINHIKKSGNQIFKFLCTPEGLPKLISAIRYCGINPYTDYFLLVDEFHKLTKDISYRVNISIAMRDFFDFQNKAMISATPFRPSDPRFQDFKFIKVVHQNNYKKPIHLVYTNNLTTAFKDYLAKYDGEMLFVFFSTLSGIHSLITSNQLEGLCNVYCSKDGTEDFKLKDFNNAYDSIDKDNLARINFLTSSFFNGLDISEFEEMPDILILTDIKYAEHTMIDPNTDTFQILGRFRPKDFRKDPRDRYRTATHIINTRHVTHIKLEEQAIKDFKLSEYRYNQILELQATLTDDFLKYDVCGEALKRVYPYSNLLNSEGDLDYFKYDNYLYEHRLKMCHGHELAPGLTYWYSNLFDVTEEKQLFLDEEFESMTRQIKRYSKENIKRACEAIDELKQYDSPQALDVLNHWFTRFPLIERALKFLGYDAIEGMGYSSGKIQKALLALDIAEKRIHQGTIDIVYKHFAPNTSYPVALVKEKLKKIFAEYGIQGSVKATDITLYFTIREYTGHQRLTKTELKLLKPDQPDIDVIEVEGAKAKSVRMYNLLERKHNAINLNTTRSAKFIVK